MALWAVLGEELHHATVIEQSILGGQTKTAFEARWDALGSGALPTSPATDPASPRGKLLAEVDVADLESEAKAGYDLADGWDADCKAVLDEDDGTRRAEGGRFRRSFDAFTVDLPGEPVRMTLRAAVDDAVTVTIRAGGAEVGTIELPEGTWVERTIELPARAAGKTPIEVRAAAGHTFGSLHYWFFAKD